MEDLYSPIVSCTCFMSDRFPKDSKSTICAATAAASTQHTSKSSRTPRTSGEVCERRVPIVSEAMRSEVPISESGRTAAANVSSASPFVTAGRSTPKKRILATSDDASTHRISSDHLWPRTPDFRYRVYVLENGEPTCLAAASTMQGVGVALCTLADENQPARVMAILDAVERRWVTSLWPPKGA